MFLQFSKSMKLLIQYPFKVFQLDAVAFGNLTQVFYTPMNSDVLRKFMEENTPNLVSFIQQMREMYWKDWDEACQTLSLNTQNVTVNCGDANK